MQYSKDDVLKLPLHIQVRIMSMLAYNFVMAVENTTGAHHRTSALVYVWFQKQKSIGVPSKELSVMGEGTCRWRKLRLFIDAYMCGVTPIISALPSCLVNQLLMFVYAILWQCEIL